MDTLALILAIVGAINWGLVGIFRFDLVAWIFGGQTAGLSRVIFSLVGLADDVIKAVLKRPEGLRAWHKIVAQLALSAGAACFCYYSPYIGSSIYIHSEELKTFNYAINQVVTAGVQRAGASAAATVVMMIVPITVFVLSQSQIIETMGSSGMKD